MSRAADEIPPVPYTGNPNREPVGPQLPQTAEEKLRAAILRASYHIPTTLAGRRITLHDWRSPVAKVTDRETNDPLGFVLWEVADYANVEQAGELPAECVASSPEVAEDIGADWLAEAKALDAERDAGRAAAAVPPLEPDHAALATAFGDEPLDDATAASVARGIAQSQRGDVVDAGSFAGETADDVGDIFAPIEATLAADAAPAPGAEPDADGAIDDAFFGTPNPPAAPSATPVAHTTRRTLPADAGDYACTSPGCSAGDCPNCRYVRRLERTILAADVKTAPGLRAAVLDRIETLEAAQVVYDAARDAWRAAHDALDAHREGEPAMQLEASKALQEQGMTKTDAGTLAHRMTYAPFAAFTAETRRLERERDHAADDLSKTRHRLNTARVACYALSELTMLPLEDVVAETDMKYGG